MKTQYVMMIAGVVILSFLLVVGYAVYLGGSRPRPNQVQGIQSPVNGDALWLNIVTTDTGSRWKAIIKDANGHLLVEDEIQDFSASHAVYWVWSTSGTAWVMSSDTGAFFGYVNVKTGVYVKKDKKEMHPELPPASILPDSAR